MIKVDRLSKHFGAIQAVNEVSLEINEGETFVLLGTSGCGKTTTLKMLNRLIEPTSGTIFINGRNINDQSPEILRRSIGYVLQNNGLFPHYTVAENIAVVPRLLKWDDKKIRNRTYELLEKLHLSSGELNKYPNKLSGGQQQRVGLARALIADPPVLLMDEPLGALDNVTRAKIQAEFKNLDELKRKTIVMVTHDIQEAFELGDRIGIMDKGVLVQEGVPADLLFKPANNFISDFLHEQRLQLELQSVKLADIWDTFPNVVQQSSVTVNAKDSLWHAMEIFTSGKAESIQVTGTGVASRSITLEQLMSAYKNYRHE
ncbi:ABC transporter ATP-binding protein [Mucilaginibacter limnophilus]|uniref:ABC transporter ATP-binding protein n=1 Tax=Mucilaginibacter limnophilus TaxID=1932778 RepID=A0A437MKH4_9SPHI|nr:ABC transporter ATP-binding protein [Mucilaginibacter limnophilus]RVT98119.1 ABC transporter ATP-binding protein [Mucilaginibacter limnophilus]